MKRPAKRKAKKPSKKGVLKSVGQLLKDKNVRDLIVQIIRLIIDSKR